MKGDIVQTNIMKLGLESKISTGLISYQKILPPYLEASQLASQPETPFWPNLCYIYMHLVLVIFVQNKIKEKWWSQILVLVLLATRK